MRADGGYQRLSHDLLRIVFQNPIAGLRIGWVCAAKPVIDQLVLLKQAGDLHTPTLNQIAIAQVANGDFEGHLERIRASYRARRDRMLAALEQHMPKGVEWTRPEGGMFVWLTLPKGMDGAKLLADALKSEKVAFVPGGAFFADGSGQNSLRLNFSSPSQQQIDVGIARLGRVLTGALRA